MNELLKTVIPAAENPLVLVALALSLLFLFFRIIVGKTPAPKRKEGTKIIWFMLKHGFWAFLLITVLSFGYAFYQEYQNARSSQLTQQPDVLEALHKLDQKFDILIPKAKEKDEEIQRLTEELTKWHIAVGQKEFIEGIDKIVETNGSATINKGNYSRNVITIIESIVSLGPMPKSDESLFSTHKSITLPVADSSNVEAVLSSSTEANLQSIDNPHPQSEPSNVDPVIEAGKLLIEDRWSSSYRNWGDPERDADKKFGRNCEPEPIDWSALKRTDKAVYDLLIDLKDLAKKLGFPATRLNSSVPNALGVDIPPIPPNSGVWVEYWDVPPTNVICIPKQDENELSMAIHYFRANARYLFIQKSYEDHQKVAVDWHEGETRFVHYVTACALVVSGVLPPSFDKRMLENFTGPTGVKGLDDEAFPDFPYIQDYFDFIANRIPGDKDRIRNAELRFAEGLNDCFLLKDI